MTDTYSTLDDLIEHEILPQLRSGGFHPDFDVAGFVQALRDRGTIEWDDDEQGFVLYPYDDDEYSKLVLDWEERAVLGNRKQGNA